MFGALMVDKKLKWVDKKICGKTPSIFCYYRGWK